jgi:GNAT superfamily N-acetyltransferase
VTKSEKSQPMPIAERVPTPGAWVYRLRMTVARPGHVTGRRCRHPNLWYLSFPGFDDFVVATEQSHAALEEHIVMVVEVVAAQNESECQALGAFLADRIYEFNAEATGYHDGLLLAGCIRNETGAIVAGCHGHTWGGCCELAQLWVNERYRGRGLGRQLLESAEAEAAARGCVQVVLATHSFQAPGFYERMGYEQKYVIEGRPQGHRDIIYVKALQR